MTFVVIIAICIGGLWVGSLVMKAKANTLTARIERRRKTYQSMWWEEWRQTRALGSSESVRDWVKRKFPIIDDDWLKNNAAGLNDEQLIERAISFYLSQPHVVDHLIKATKEEHLQELEEQSIE